MCTSSCPDTQIVNISSFILVPTLTQNLVSQSFQAADIMSQQMVANYPKVISVGFIFALHFLLGTYHSRHLWIWNFFSIEHFCLSCEFEVKQVVRVLDLLAWDQAAQWGKKGGDTEKKSWWTKQTILQTPGFFSPFFPTVDPSPIPGYRFVIRQP